MTWDCWACWVITDGALSDATLSTLVVGNPAGLYRVQMMQAFAGPDMLQDLGLGSGAAWQLNGIGAADWNLGSTDTSQPGTPLEDVKLDWIFGYQDVDVQDQEAWAQLDSTPVLDKVVLSLIDSALRSYDHERQHADCRCPHAGGRQTKTNPGVLRTGVSLSV